jgi:hypothetical protein
MPSRDGIPAIPVNYRDILKRRNRRPSDRSVNRFSRDARHRILLARLEELWQRVPRYKPLSVGVVLLDLVPAAQHQPDLFAADTGRHQKLSPLVDRINDRYGRCAIGFGLFPPDVRAFKGHAAFHRVPERWGF